MLNAGETPTAMEFKSSMPMELLGKEGVMKRVSAGHLANEAPTVSRSTTKNFSTPACMSAMAAPMPAAPAPMTMVS